METVILSNWFESLAFWSCGVGVLGFRVLGCIGNSSNKWGAKVYIGSKDCG